jgi:hypothetical protein
MLCLEVIARRVNDIGGGLAMKRLRTSGDAKGRAVYLVGHLASFQ